MLGPTENYASSETSSPTAPLKLRPYGALQICLLLLLIYYYIYVRLRNDLYCVEWGVKLYSLTHSPSVVEIPIAKK